MSAKLTCRTKAIYDIIRTSANFIQNGTQWLQLWRLYRWKGRYIELIRNSKSDNVEEVYDMPWDEPLHEDVGIVYVKVTQSTGKHFNEMAGVGVCIDKPAKEKEQTSLLTNKIKSLIESASTVNNPFL